MVARWALDCVCVGPARTGSGDEGGHAQIYVIDPMGGEARQVTKLDDGVDGFEWAPDSKTIAFTTKDPLSKAQKDRVERYGEYTVIDGDERMTHLWTVDVTAAPVAAPERRG